MTGKNVTRVDLTEAMYQKVGLSRSEAADMVDQVVAEICDCLASGENVKLSGFGLFSVRDKRERVGRNPKTGVEVPITPRRVVAFTASHILKTHINGTRKKSRSRLQSDPRSSAQAR